MSSPLARGLFHRACILGGPPFGLKSREAAADTAELVLARAGLSPAASEGLQEMPVEQLMEIQAALGAGSVRRACPRCPARR